MNFLTKFLSFFLMVSLISCTLFDPDRKPAGKITMMSGNHRVELNIPFKDLQAGFNQATKNSKVIKSIDHFYMDPITRIFNIKLTANYPLDKLLDYTSLPKSAQISDEHIVELAFKFSKTKDLFKSRYVGLELTKFKIDHDDYLNQFELVLAVIQTVLANSNLTDYLLIKGRDNMKNKDMVSLVSEAFAQNVIFPIPTRRRINIKLDLSMIAHTSPYLKMYEDVNLWRLSPSILKIRDEKSYYKDELLPEDVAFTIAVGTGKPDKEYAKKQFTNTEDDKRTLEEVRNDFYKIYSNIENVKKSAEMYMNQLLGFEGTTRREDSPFKRLLEKKISLEGEKGKQIIDQMRVKYQSEIDNVLGSIEKKAKKELSMDNEHFIAAPEYEYGEFLIGMKSKIRSNLYELERSFGIDYKILQQGKHFSTSKPMLVKRVSQNFLNKALNAVVDIQFEGEQVIENLSVWLLPHKDGMILKGQVKIPFKLLKEKSNIGLDLDHKKLSEYITPGAAGVPFEVHIKLKMQDEGKLGLDINKLSFDVGGVEQEFKRDNKNHRFIFDFAKMYLAKALSSLEIDLNETTNPVEAKKRETAQVLKYLDELNTAYNGTSEMEGIFKSDFLINPFNTAGAEYLERKKKILVGGLINFNEIDQVFEVQVDPKIIVDKVNNVDLNLQVWDITPVMSTELNNTFLELSLGAGKRSTDFIHQQKSRSGVAENAKHSGIYYNLGEERASVDLLMSLNFEYLEDYINGFLKDMVSVNKTDIIKQAEKKPDESFYEISDIKLKIIPSKSTELNTNDRNQNNMPKNLIKLEAKVSSAKYARDWDQLLRFRLPRKRVINDTHAIHAELELESTKFTQENTSITDLVYYPSAIKINPRNARVAPGSSNSFISKALTKIINTGLRIGLNDGAIKKLLLRMVNKITKKMYVAKDGKIMGHEMEKFARIHTTSNEILIFLNPKLAGPGFNMHLSGDEDPVNTAIKLDQKQQIMHFALTAGTGMAKAHKKELIDIYKDLTEYLIPFEKAKSKEELMRVLQGPMFAQGLLMETSVTKRAFYRRFISILLQYDQVLHTTNLSNDIGIVGGMIRGRIDNNNDVTSKAEQTRISVSGAELLYFAAIAKYFHKKLVAVTSKMVKFDLNNIQTGDVENYNIYNFENLKRVRDILSQNIYAPLIKKYEEKNQAVNKIILSNPPSYWTYQIYPNSFFAEKIHTIIKD